MSVELAFVLALIPKIPAECSLYTGKNSCPIGTVGHYERGKDTREIAEAIAFEAVDKRDAKEMAVYAAYEGQNDLSSVGDNGRSHGPWQTPFQRTSAHGYLLDWIGIRKLAVAKCPQNDKSTRLAMLASGYCDRGTKKVRKRDEVIETLGDD